MAHEVFPALAADSAFLIVVTLGDSEGVGKREDVADGFGFIEQVPIPQAFERDRVVVPGGPGIVLRTAE